MNKNYKIKSVSIEGARNIVKPIKIDFFKKKNLTDEDINFYNVKGIYGPNRSGKSSIYEAINIYYGLMIYKDYLTDTNLYLKAFINQKLRRFSINFEYVTKENENKIIYAHYIELRISNNGDVIISKEKLRRNDIELFVIDTSEENKIKICEQKKFKKIEKYLIKIADKHKNLESRQPFYRTETDYIISLEKNNEIFSSNIIEFIFSRDIVYAINLIAEEKNDHSGFIRRELTSTDDLTDQEMKEINHKYSAVRFHLRNNNIFTREIIPKNHLKGHLKNVKLIENFLKIFTYDLVSIDCKYKKLVENDIEMYRLEHIFNYVDYSGNYEFESTGIKKLCTLAVAILKVINGEILVIDEIDANLHDYALEQILDYLNQNATGQLIFTSHNVMSLDSLSGIKNSIDFISLNNNIITWRRMGNTSITRAYHKGLINSTDFSYDSFDFEQIFTIGDNSE